MPDVPARSVLYLVTSSPCGGSAPGIRRAIAEAGRGGRVVLLYVHDPKREEGLREALSSGAFVGLKQVEDVASAAWRSAEACGREALEEAKTAAREASVETTLVVARGPLAETVRAHVREHEAACVVVCRPGGSLIGRLLQPSEVRRLGRLLDVPVIEVAGPGAR